MFYSHTQHSAMTKNDINIFTEICNSMGLCTNRSHGARAHTLGLDSGTSKTKAGQDRLVRGSLPRDRKSLIEARVRFNETRSYKSCYQMICYGK